MAGASVTKPKLEITPIAQARWRRSDIAEAVARSHVSAPCYRFPKDVFFVAIVESETGLRKALQKEPGFFAAL
jgi:hypothetical protein